MPIRLPDNPKDKQYEDLIAACFLSLGNFVETRITFKEGSTEVLELDLVATPADERFTKRVLVEAKAGSWGFGDLFKLYGWMTFLGITTSCLTHRKPLTPEQREAFEAIGKRTGVSSCHIQVDADRLPAPAALPKPSTELEEGLWYLLLPATWFGQIAQRLTWAAFRHHCKSDVDSAVVPRARQYESAVQQSFFQQNPLRRVYQLYRGYQGSPRLAGEFVQEVASCKHCDTKGIWAKVDNTCELPWLQFVLFLEHRARLLVIKNGLESHLSTGTGEIAIDGQKYDWNKLLKAMLPLHFRTGMEKLASYPFCTRVPYLLQLFIEVFGGFYSISDEDDITLMSKLSGVPKDRVHECLDLINVFFPFEKGWFYNVKDELRCMKLVPAFLRGAGCFLRTRAYNLDAYPQKYPRMGWLLADWHNAHYEILSAELGFRTAQT